MRFLANRKSRDNTISQKSVAGITNFSYTYDGNKRKTSETDGTMSSLSQTFSYDFEDRLTSWASNGTTLNQTQSWNLSLEGAWNSTTVNGNTENRTFNQTYEILTSNANAMTHDRKGNLTTNKDGSLYTWDFNNQLAFSTAGTPSVNTAYAYDALGRRVSKSSGNTITIFVHSNYQIATEYKSSNGGAFTEHQSFVYASYIDDPIALISTNGTYFYHSNQQFSIGAITDSNGNLSERYGYNAYGKPVIITDSILVDNPYFFTGRQLDSETGLFYFRARYYDASLGQFVSRDPLNYVDGMNLYRGYFVPNDLDSFGLNKEDDEKRKKSIQPTDDQIKWAKVTRNAVISASKSDPCYVYIFLGHTYSGKDDYENMKKKGAENIGLLACYTGLCYGLQNWPLIGSREKLGVGGTENSREYLILNDQRPDERKLTERFISVIESALKSANDKAKSLADNGPKCDCPHYYVQIICTGDNVNTQIRALNWYNREKGTNLSCGGIVSTYENKNHDLNDPSCCETSKY